ncbi:MAG: Uma2 family endonuclease [Cytophagales bacterium]|jgi:Uma2 family endonuclease|nr:Uma2 family endonuclease [Cytophagales bacterium]
METTIHKKTPKPATSRTNRKTQADKSIPKHLIYEEMDGIPIYYAGYREVISGKQTFESIMGSSSLQGTIISCLLKYLYRNLDDKDHFVYTNEIGLHLKKGANLSSDIAIYDRDTLKKTPINNQYFEIPPLAVVEVDTKADVPEANRLLDENYYAKKTQNLLEFGVKEVIWIFTGIKKIMVARPHQDWYTSDWTKEIVLLEKHNFSLAGLLKDEGLVDV